MTKTKARDLRIGDKINLLRGSNREIATVISGTTFVTGGVEVYVQWEDGTEHRAVLNGRVKFEVFS